MVFFLLIFIVPFILTAGNIYFLLFRPKTPKQNAAAEKIEIIGAVLGVFLMILYLSFMEIEWKDWHVQLFNRQTHTPIETTSSLTLVAIAIVVVIAYAYARFVPLDIQPPLLTIFSMAALYLGMVLCVVWCVQVFRPGFNDFVLCILPLNCIVIAIRTIYMLIFQKIELQKEDTSPKMGKLSTLLNKAWCWPILGLVLAVPLLGMIVMVMTLFGQQPDSIIKVWTETAGWNLSQKTAPQNIQYDEHYLCTVAAGGHRHVVKPLRLGKRHGHTVVVNRQLCIANAFEQLLEERLPRVHHAVRAFYDKAGYPIARHIRSKLVADMIYVVMKPLEWIFLFCLYLFDVKPENRIAVQYPHAKLPEFKSRAD